MRLVVHNLELPFNHLSDAPAGPHLTAKAVCFRTMRQQIRNLSQLVRGEFRRPARMGMCAQCLFTLRIGHPHPLADRTWRDTERRGDVLLLPTLALE